MHFHGKKRWIRECQSKERVHGEGSISLNPLILWFSQDGDVIRRLTRIGTRLHFGLRFTVIAAFGDWKSQTLIWKLPFQAPFRYKKIYSNAKRQWKRYRIEAKMKRTPLTIEEICYYSVSVLERITLSWTKQHLKWLSILQSTSHLREGRENASFVLCSSAKTQFPSNDLWATGCPFC